MYSATYSPEDNKLRLYASSRLDADLYKRVRGAGFIWAPKQDLFVAPMWTPEREDLLLELAGEVGDEDTSLVERAEERADRFDDYRLARAHDAEQARKAVDRIADNIPLGQPILVGHHSERHARKDAEKIENGMRRAVRMWETSEYWKSRASGAIRAAKYKELPNVRARRIRTLEADERRWKKNRAHQELRIALWSKPLTFEQARLLAGRSNTTDMDTYFALDKGQMTAEQASQIVLGQAKRYLETCDRWLQHTANRLEYERAMLSEVGGTAADQTKPEVGGACRVWCSPRHGWSYIRKVNKVSVTVEDNWGNGGPNFTRTVPFHDLHGVMSVAEVEAARADGRLVETDGRGFLLAEAPTFAERCDIHSDHSTPQAAQKCTELRGQAEAFDAMRETLRAGIKVVAAPQLFPTPPEIAARMVQLAGVEAGMTVLEPSAGTGRIVDALDDVPGAKVTAIEINCSLADNLRLRSNTKHAILCSDFLECNGNLGKFDRVLMNPPFENGADIKHITHALSFLAPGGRLVAICANGPRQQDKLQPLCDSWEELPEGTFNGTGVRTVLLSMREVDIA